jgi:hypothetical protein
LNVQSSFDPQQRELAYARACYQFFHWARENGLTLDTVRPFHVAAYIEQMPGSKPTVDFS